MERLFQTHKVRKSEELNGLWKFSTQGKREMNKTVVVPSCIEMYPGFENYRGISYFQKEIKAKGNTRIRFSGVSHFAKVYFDGELITQHYNAYTPFDAIICNVEDGIHQIVVENDNTFSENSALHVPNDYYTYGGITRGVTVESLTDTYIRTLHISPIQRDHIWYIGVEANIINFAEDKEYTLEFVLNDVIVGKETIQLTHGVNAIKREYCCNGVKEYSLNNPNLYYLAATLYDRGVAVDDLIERFGFREIHYQKDGIYINQEKVRILGVNRHEDYATFGCAIPIEAMVNDLELIKDLGCNAVRTCHYPNDEIFLDLCDEYGILVWEEGHARGMSLERMQNPNFRKQSLDCIEEMIENHYNHPAIFVWGILNECQSQTDYGRIVYQEQYDKILSMDKTRPRTSATCQLFHDICLDIPEVISVNIYSGWYVDEDTKGYFAKVKDWIQQIHFEDKPLIVSEVGAGGIYGYRSSARPKWSEDRQCDILKEQLTALLSDESVAGVFIWQFADTRVTEEEWFAVRPKTMNNKGLVDEYRRRKLAYDVVKEMYHKYKGERM